MNFLSTFINVLIIVVLAVPGYFLRRCRLLPDKAASVFAVLLLYISQPFLMLSSLLAGHRGYCGAKEAITADLNQALMRTWEEKQDNIVTQDSIRAYRQLRRNSDGPVWLAIADKKLCRNLKNGKLKDKTFLSFDVVDAAYPGTPTKDDFITSDTLLVNNRETGATLAIKSCARLSTAAIFRMSDQRWSFLLALSALVWAIGFRYFGRRKQVENEEPVMNNPFATGTSSTGNIVTTQREYNLEDLLKNDKTLQDFIDIRTNIEVKNKKDKVIATIKDGVFYIDDEVVDEEKFNKYVKRKGETVNIIKQELAQSPLPMPSDTLRVQSTLNLAEINNLSPLNIDLSQYNLPGENIVVTNAQIKQFVKDASEKYGIDEELLLAVIKQESHFKSNATSYAGAQGLMQLMPATARGLGVKDPFDPQQNINGGTKLLKILLKTYDGDVRLALAAYNHGIGNVNRKLAGKPQDIKYIYDSLPRETRNYVDEVYANYITTKASNRGTLS